MFTHFFNRHFWTHINSIRFWQHPKPECFFAVGSGHGEGYDGGRGTCLGEGWLISLLDCLARIKLFLSTLHRFEPNGFLIPYLWAAGGPTRWEQQFRQGSSACKRFRKPLLCASIASFIWVKYISSETIGMFQKLENCSYLALGEKKISHDTNQFQDKTKVVTETHLLDLNKVRHVKTH